MGTGERTEFCLGIPEPAGRDERESAEEGRGPEKGTVGWAGAGRQLGSGVGRGLSCGSGGPLGRFLKQNRPPGDPAPRCSLCGPATPVNLFPLWLL